MVGIILRNSETFLFFLIFYAFRYLDFDLSQATLFAGNLSSDRIVQVTRDFVSLISGDGTFKTKWVSPAKLSLCSANMNSGQLVVGSGAEIFYLVAASDEIRLVGKLECTNEISCIDITPVGKRFLEKKLLIFDFYSQIIREFFCTLKL